MNITKATIAAIKMKPIRLRPRWCLKFTGAFIGSSITNYCMPRNTRLKAKRRNVVPVEPDEERLAAQMTVGNETPVATVGLLSRLSPIAR